MSHPQTLALALAQAMGLGLLLSTACSDTPPAPPTTATKAKTEAVAETSGLCGPTLVESCRLLVSHPLLALEGEGMCRLCGEGQGWCGRRWPAEVGQVSCALWEDLELCIWQAAGTRSFPALPPVARDNVAELQRRLDAQEGCVPVGEGVR